MGRVGSRDQQGSNSMEVLAGHTAAKLKEILCPWLEAALRHPRVGHNILSATAEPGPSCTRIALLETSKEKAVHSSRLD